MSKEELEQWAENVAPLITKLHMWRTVARVAHPAFDAWRFELNGKWIHSDGAQALMKYHPNE